MKYRSGNTILYLFFVVAMHAQGFSDENTVVKLSSNPTANIHQPQNSKNEIDLSFISQNGDAYLSYDGKLKNTLLLDVKSRQAMEHITLFGNASFYKGKQNNVIWNESADYTTVYPYIMADSVRNAPPKQFEQYAFSGGVYSKNGNRINWGAEIRYNALHEYRMMDPRPNNTSSDLHIDMGITNRIGKDYTIGIGAGIRKYIQSNRLRFNKELGAPIVLHLTGLGNHAYIFAGNKTNVFFDVLGYCANLHFSFSNPYRVFIDMEYKEFKLDKLLSEFQYLPISHINEKEITARLSWKIKNSEKAIHRFDVVSYYKWRVGTENKFQLPQYGNYVKIADAETYKNEQIYCEIQYLYQNQISNNTHWWLQPNISATKTNERYHSLLPINKDISLFTGGITSELKTKIKKNQFSVQGNMSYNKIASARFNVNEVDSQYGIQHTLWNDFLYQSQNAVIANLSLRFTRSVGRDSMRAYTFTNYQHERYSETSKFNSIKIGIGVIF